MAKFLEQLEKECQSNHWRTTFIERSKNKGQIGRHFAMWWKFGEDRPGRWILQWRRHRRFSMHKACTELRYHAHLFDDYRIAVWRDQLSWAWNAVNIHDGAVRPASSAGKLELLAYGPPPVLLSKVRHRWRRFSKVHSIAGVDRIFTFGVSRAIFYRPRLYCILTLLGRRYFSWPCRTAESQDCEAQL